MKSAVWHPNTQMKEWKRFDEIIYARGMFLYDKKGRRFLDGVASMWCNVWGHSEPELIRAIKSQIKDSQHTSLFNLTNPPAEQLAKKMIKLCPEMSQIFYADNGSSAIEIAIKMAMQYWKNIGELKRTKFVSLKNGYHGDTFGAMSVGYVPQFFSTFKEKLFKCIQMPVPNSYRLPKKTELEDYTEYCLNRIENLFKKDERIGVFIMESGAQVAGGVNIYPPNFQKQISRLCKKYGILLILDEIATGFGRLGNMTEYKNQQSKPDIVSFGKMLTGGYLSFAATLTTKKIYNAFLGNFDENRHLFHGHTYTGNPIAAATALKNIELYKKRNLLSKIKVKSKIFEQYYDKFYELKLVGDVRHKGMLMGIELVKNKKTKKPLTLKESINKILFEIGKKNGVYFRTLGNIVMIVPPLAMSENYLSELLEKTIKSIEMLKNF